MRTAPQPVTGRPLSSCGGHATARTLRQRLRSATSQSTASTSLPSFIYDCSRLLSSTAATAVADCRTAVVPSPVILRSSPPTTSCIQARSRAHLMPSLVSAHTMLMLYRLGKHRRGKNPSPEIFKLRRSASPREHPLSSPLSLWFSRASTPR
jgi:hypothetical protein